MGPEDLSTSAQSACTPLILRIWERKHQEMKHPRESSAIAFGSGATFFVCSLTLWSARSFERAQSLKLESMSEQILVAEHKRHQRATNDNFHRISLFVYLWIFYFILWLNNAIGKEEDKEERKTKTKPKI